MKKKITIALFAAMAAVVVIDAFNNNVFTYTAGAPTGKTGSPGDGESCSCHGSPNAKAGWITSNVPTAGYTPGSTYTITATCTNANETAFGFEISPQNNAGTLLGTLIATNTTETQLIGSGKYITQTSSGITGSGSKVWTFNWTAPAKGTGTVSFYGAFVGGYSNVFSSILQVNEVGATTTGNEILTSNSISVFPNPFNHKTTLSYSLAVSSQVTIEACNLLGEKIKTLVDERQATGNFQYTVFANELGVGVYFIKCKINEETRVVKLIAVE